MGSTRRSFTEEYKDEAVRFVIEGNRSVAEVARNIGVHEMTLGKWVKKVREAEAAATPADAPLTETERMELIRLRAGEREKDATISELRMQVEFAKKVATWFAREKQ
jgi:transposase